jgi:hypothetical protein
LAEPLRAAIVPGAQVASFDVRTDRHHLISSAQISTFSSFSRKQAKVCDSGGEGWPNCFELNAGP